MNKLIRKHWKTGLFALVGAILGFAYWRFIGCTSGTCPLTSDWHTTTLFGGLIGIFASPANRKSRLKKDPGPDEKLMPQGDSTPEKKLTPSDKSN